MLSQKAAVIVRLTVYGILLFGLFASLIGAVACLEEEGKYAPELQIVSHSMSYDEYGGAIVEGIAKNAGGSEVGELEVRVKFYDAEGNLIRTYSDYIEHVGAGETCRFKVRTGLHAESYKIAIFKTR